MENDTLTMGEKVSVKAAQPSTWASASALLAAGMVAFGKYQTLGFGAFADPEFLGSLAAIGAGLVGLFKKHPQGTADALARK